MKSIDIKILLLRSGITQASLAKRLGVTLPFVNHIITGRRATKRVRKAIAKALGRRVEDLWPADAKALAGRPESNRRKPQNHVVFGAALDHVGSRARKAA